MLKTLSRGRVKAADAVNPPALPMCPLHKISLVISDDPSWKGRMLVCPAGACSHGQMLPPKKSRIQKAPSSKNPTPTRSTPTEPLEEAEAKALWKKIRENVGKYPELDLITHIPNEGRRSVVAGASMNAQGMRAGYPDYIFAVAREGYHGMFLELKRLTQGGLKPNQREWGVKLQAAGYYWECCRGAEDAWAAIVWYYNLERAHYSTSHRPTRKPIR